MVAVNPEYVFLLWPPQFRFRDRPWPWSSSSKLPAKTTFVGDSLSLGAGTKLQAPRKKNKRPNSCQLIFSSEQVERKRFSIQVEIDFYVIRYFPKNCGNRRKKNKPTKKSALPTAGNIVSTQDFFVKQKRVLRQTPIFVRLKLQYRKPRPSQDISEWGKIWFPKQFLITYPTAPAAGHKLKAPTHCFQRGIQNHLNLQRKTWALRLVHKAVYLKASHHFTHVHAEENIENCSVVSSSRLNRILLAGDHSLNYGVKKSFWSRLKMLPIFNTKFKRNNPINGW